MSHPDPSAAAARRATVTARGEGPLMNVLGDRQRVKLTGADTEGRFTLIENENPPGVEPPLHCNEDEVFYVLDGRVEFEADGERYDAGPGTTVFLPKGVPHRWKTVGEETARMLIMLMPAGLEGLFRELSDLPPGPPDMERVLAMAGHYGIEFLPPPEGGPEAG